MEVSNGTNVLFEELDLQEQQRVKGEVEKWVSSWLWAVAIEAAGYVLDKQEFRDAIWIWYRWRIEGTPTHCACGEKNYMDRSCAHWADAHQCNSV